MQFVVLLLRSKALFLDLNDANSSLLIVRRKSKQALRDYKKVQIQLENLETSVRDRCKKEFTGEETRGADSDMERRK